MKIIVFSDSHGNVSNMIEVVEREAPDRVFHLGDCLRDAKELQMAYPDLEMDTVPGNCDWRSTAPQEKKLTIQGYSLLLCHGHDYGVKSGLGSLAYHARQEKVSMALFGHTHEAQTARRGGVRLCNPGSCGMGYEPTYGVLTIADGCASFHIKPVQEEE
ncbi:MAG: YfcE family phosphodiesterase [Clostridiales bacterium]|nr:YfcE family phosphodiesterase [Clostridiales bacterium]